MNGDLPLDNTPHASMLMGDWTPQASARQRADQHHIEPSVLSPHARVSLKQIVQQQQLLTYGKSQRLSGGLDSGGWTPAFNPGQIFAFHTFYLKCISHFNSLMHGLINSNE